MDGLIIKIASKNNTEGRVTQKVTYNIRAAVTTHATEVYLQLHCLVVDSTLQAVNGYFD